MTGGNRSRPTRRRLALGGLAAACLLAAIATVVSAMEPRSFTDPALERRYRSLTYELRCLVCQNQNIADSNADLAKDLRDRVDRMLRAGNSDEEIVQFMVDRYGEFVLYRPRLSARTVLLWVGPFALAVLGLGMLAWQVTKNRRRQPVFADGDGAALSAPQRARVEALLRADGPGASGGARDRRHPPQHDRDWGPGRDQDLGQDQDQDRNQERDP